MGIFVGVVASGALVLGGCEIPNTSDTQCSGYLGCSARQSSNIGVSATAPPATGAAGTGAAGTGAAGTGAAGTGAPAAGINAVLPGMGCNKGLPDGQFPAMAGTPRGYFKWTVQGTGKTLAADQPAKVGPRTFWVRVPPDYDPSHAYRVIYVGQGCGSYNTSNTETLQLFKEAAGGSEQAIYVALDIPTDMANMNCYDNRDGPTSQEWEAFELFHTVVDSNYCVDNNRVYVSGYSTGGWLANMWGCYFAGDGQNPAGTPGVPRKFASKYHIRAQAAVTGGEPANNPPCNGKVAAIWIHDAGDNGNPISGNQAGLMRVLTMNGCVGSPKAAWHPEVTAIGPVCQQYTACPADYPVVFCTTNGLGHADQHERAVPAFKLFFDLLEPK